MAYYMLPLDRLEPASSASSWLGRIVRDYRDLNAGSVPRNPSQFYIEEPTETPFEDVKSFVFGAADQELKAQLTGIGSAVHGHGQFDTTDFSTSAMKSIRLPQYRDVFDDMIADQEILAKLRTWLRLGGKPAFMIISLFVWTDVSLIEAKGVSSGTTLEAKIPLSAAFAAAGTPQPVPDPDLGKSSTTTGGRILQASIKGSKIFAIELKTVRRKTFSVGPSFKPILVDSGPRMKEEKQFDPMRSKSTHYDGQDSGMELDMDEDEADWVDAVDEAPKVEDINGVRFAYHA
ncbi:hypothetical protein JMJ35_001788 [Cladonia borealis]|uniref:Uncharacterized protein n=1 Tax=Cladonia borealis TaxID=184061 RepID=A0AA39R8T6_9LECA|nr:hypothetical protein JMJ35_001788 [Cladonia borealis]